MTTVIHATTAQLDELLAGDVPVLIDFAAEWCGPCKAMSPAIEAFAAERDGAVVVAKVDVDQNRDAAIRYGVRGIPTLILVKGGQVKATKSGAMSKAQVTAFVDIALTQ